MTLDLQLIVLSPLSEPALAQVLLVMGILSVLAMIAAAFYRKRKFGTFGIPPNPNATPIERIADSIMLTGGVVATIVALALGVSKC